MPEYSMIDIDMMVIGFPSGLDYGTMGEKLLYQFNSWCS